MICLSVYPSIRLSVHPSIRLSVYPIMKRPLLTAILLLTTASLFSQAYIAFGYGPSFPLTKLNDYIDKTSWRTFNIEGGYFVTKDFAFGASFSWYGYYNSFPYDTYENIQGSTVTVSGKQWRYANVYPLMAMARYYLPLKGNFKPFTGAGFGPCFVNRKLDFGVWSFTDHTTQFGFYPELGLSYWFKKGFSLSFDARYNYAVKNKDLEGHSNVALNMGLVWKL
jgi:opacity protein-like surface antigen